MKKIIPWVILIILICLIFYPQPSRFTNTTIPKMNSHVLNKEIRLQLPATMQIVENRIENRHQLHYSAYLNDEQFALRGYIQLWQIDDIEHYLQKSKEMSTFDFYTYSLNNTHIGDFKGILNIWGASFGESAKLSGKEYWLHTPNQKMLRIAFLTKDTHFNEEQLKTMGYILSSLNWLGEPDMSKQTYIEIMGEN
ncbi:MAG TPA: hypothetical protein GX523_18105 [Desulfitobacterium dehalogenans]|uniref:Uncharacterized protein n=1 Tax=Desulfitobacterium dehalogenans TaxID=36854 RepID=A0A7C7D851_9FIRM|nr:hypothetical protein [Desulfitobacterium dehalogenans]